MRALRMAGKALVVATFDPAKPNARVPREAEIMIPMSEICASSQVKKPEDRGTLVIPLWLACDRGLALDEEN